MGYLTLLIRACTPKCQFPLKRFMQEAFRHAGVFIAPSFA